MCHICLKEDSRFMKQQDYLFMSCSVQKQQDYLFMFCSVQEATFLFTLKCHYHSSCSKISTRIKNRNACTRCRKRCLLWTRCGIVELFIAPPHVGPSCCRHWRRWNLLTAVWIWPGGRCLIFWITSLFEITEIFLRSLHLPGPRCCCRRFTRTGRIRKMVPERR